MKRVKMTREWWGTGVSMGGFLVQPWGRPTVPYKACRDVPFLHQECLCWDGVRERYHRFPRWAHLLLDTHSGLPASRRHSGTQICSFRSRDSVRETNCGQKGGAEGDGLLESESCATVSL